MAPQKSSAGATANFPFSIPALILSFLVLSFLLPLFFFFYNPIPPSSSAHITHQNPLRVYFADLPRSLNYALLDQYWSSSSPDSRISSDPDHPRVAASVDHKTSDFLPYPENPLIKQYSSEYWITGDLMTPENLRTRSFAKRVFDFNQADVVVPFFATLSAEIELARGKGTFRKKEGNEDYKRQKQVIEIVKSSEAWKRSGGRDHVFVLTGYVRT